MIDNFYTQTQCDRCRGELKPSRTLSWFTEETICMTCSAKEQEIKRALREQGISNAMEGCGYVPDAASLKPFFFTFGQKYRAEKHPAGGHPDGWFTVLAANKEQARAKMVACCGEQWAMMYETQPDSKIYPKGELKRI